MARVIKIFRFIKRSRANKRGGGGGGDVGSSQTAPNKVFWLRFIHRADEDFCLTSGHLGLHEKNSRFVFEKMVMTDTSPPQL